MITKDAGGYDGGGNHLAIYVDNGILRARFQDGLIDSFLTYGGLNAGQEYHVAATFGPNGVELYVDGVLVGADLRPGHVLGRQSGTLANRGLGWGSETARAASPIHLQV